VLKAASPAHPLDQVAPDCDRLNRRVAGIHGVGFPSKKDCVGMAINHDPTSGSSWRCDGGGERPAPNSA